MTDTYNTVARKFGVSVDDAFEADEAARALGFLGYAFDRVPAEPPAVGSRLVRYDFIRSLGSGVYGDTFSASADGTRVPRFVIKRIKSRDRAATRRLQVAQAMGLVVSSPDDETIDSMRKLVEREMRIAQVIRKRLTDEFCRLYAICGARSFYTTDFSHGYIIFPFFEAKNLLQFLNERVYNKMREFRTIRESAGYDERAIDDLLADYNAMKRRRRTQLLEEEMNQLRKVLNRIRRRLLSVQTDVFHLCNQLILAVAALHSKLIYHRDLKLDNILVDDTGSMRLIDFGLACAVKIPNGNANYDEEYGQYVACPEVFAAAVWYRDPLAERMEADETSEVLEQNAKFETYAVGKILQRMFDPDSVDARGREATYPRVRRTEFMTEEMYRLIVTMTGERNYTFSGHNDDTQPLTDDELETRLAAFERRPSMGEVAVQLAAIVRRWIADYAYLRSPIE